MDYNTYKEQEYKKPAKINVAVITTDEDRFEELKNGYLSSKELHLQFFSSVNHMQFYDDSFNDCVAGLRGGDRKIGDGVFTTDMRKGPIVFFLDLDKKGNTNLNLFDNVIRQAIKPGELLVAPKSKVSENEQFNNSLNKYMLGQFSQFRFIDTSKDFVKQIKDLTAPTRSTK